MPPPDARSSLADWLSWQESLHPKTIALGLERVRVVATRLGLPATGLCTLTVAGTNGKGSSTTLLGEIYRAAGYAVGVYTSPHLMRYNERIAVNGVRVGDAELCAAFAEVERARADTSLTYFEFGTLAALWIFRERRVQVQVLEVGLGGRLDAVNLVDADGMLITSIGLDHQDWLGNDRETIAREKAGILRRGRPAVYADVQPVAMIEQLALQVGAPLQVLGRDFIARVSADAWTWLGTGRRYKKLPMPGLDGAHQLSNAAGVIALVESLQTRLPVAESALRSALVRLSLPGRYERRGRLILDVAHNAEAAAVLCRQLQAEGRDSIRLVLGMFADKPVEAFCRALAPCVAVAHLAGLPPPRGLSAAALAARVGDIFGEISTHDSVKRAYEQAQLRADPRQTVVVCGSFLTVAAVRALLDG